MLQEAVGDNATSQSKTFYGTLMVNVKVAKDIGMKAQMGKRGIVTTLFSTSVLNGVDV
jgi:hypothetical protein